MRSATSIVIPEQASPGTPDSGYLVIFSKTDGLYYKKDDGAEVGPLAVGGSGSGVATATAGLDLNVGTLATLNALASTDGDLRVVTDLVSPTGTTSTVVEVFPFSATGPLTVQVGKGNILLTAGYVVESISVYSTVAPVGANIIVDINKNGASIYTTQANRPTVLAENNSVIARTPDITTYASGDTISIDIDQIGSTTAGGDSLTVTVRLRRV